jgi:hypothetical protein
MRIINGRVSNNLVASVVRCQWEDDSKDRGRKGHGL